MMCRLQRICKDLSFIDSSSPVACVPKLPVHPIHASNSPHFIFCFYPFFLSPNYKKTPPTPSNLHVFKASNLSIAPKSLNTSLLYHLPLSPLISHAPSATSIPTIEELMKTRTCEPNLHSTSIVMHKESHVGSKFKPKIRIVHIIAPEIIKTDVANFRELVQRLTGKPGGRQCGKKKARCSSSDVSESDVSESVSGFRNTGYGERVKEEEEMWGDENSAFFGGLGDLDGFIQGLGDFPLLPLSSSHMDVFGEGRIS